jgi:hypothetical protein
MAVPPAAAASPEEKKANNNYDKLKEFLKQRSPDLLLKLTRMPPREELAPLFAIAHRCATEPLIDDSLRDSTDWAVLKKRACDAIMKKNKSEKPAEIDEELLEDILYNYLSVPGVKLMHIHGFVDSLKKMKLNASDYYEFILLVDSLYRELITTL